MTRQCGSSGSTVPVEGTPRPASFSPRKGLCKDRLLIAGGDYHEGLAGANSKGRKGSVGTDGRIPPAFPGVWRRDGGGGKAAGSVHRISWRGFLTAVGVDFTGDSYRGAKRLSKAGGRIRSGLLFGDARRLVYDGAPDVQPVFHGVCVGMDGILPAVSAFCGFGLVRRRTRLACGSFICWNPAVYRRGRSTALWQAPFFRRGRPAVPGNPAFWKAAPGGWSRRRPVNLLDLKRAAAERMLQRPFIEIPLTCSVAQIMVFLKGKSNLVIFDRHANLKYKYGTRHFWARRFI